MERAGGDLKSSFLKGEILYVEITVLICGCINESGEPPFEEIVSHCVLRAAAAVSIRVIKFLFIRTELVLNHPYNETMTSGRAPEQVFMDVARLNHRSYKNDHWNYLLLSGLDA